MPAPVRYSVSSNGRYRRCFLFGRYALKVPAPDRPRQGKWCNIHEVELARLQLPEVCPVLFYDPEGRWLIMRRATMMTAEQFHARFEDYYKLQKSLFAAAGWDVADNSTSNFGLIDERLVVVDYGGDPPWIDGESRHSA